MKTQSIKWAQIFSTLVVLALTFSALGTTTARAAGIRYVTSTGSGDCSSWENACGLQTALTGALSGDEIWVASGVYKPTTDPSNRTATFQLINGVAVYGGFIGTETARDQRNPATNTTILSGDSNGDDSGFINNSENVYHVVTGATGATLDGFTITAGNANGNVFSNGSGNGAGGGVYNYSNNPMITNVIFDGNSATFSGGGMFNYYGSPLLTNVTFSGNRSTQGGGVYNQHGGLTLANVTFSNNSAIGRKSPYGGYVDGSGGGIYSFYSNSTLTNVTFNSNWADGYGGGLYNDNSSSTLTNVTFSGNSAKFWGGGMLTFDNGSNSNSNLRNAIFWNNTASNGGVQISVELKWQVIAC